MLWLFEVVHEFVEAVARGDKSWWPFIVAVVVITAMAIAFSVWLA